MSDTTVELGPDEAPNLDWLRASTAAAVTLKQAAAVLDVDQRTVSAAVKRGELPSIRIGRRILIPRLPLLQLLGATSK